MKTLNNSEIITGAAYGLALMLLIGPAALLLAPMTAFLWAMGGTYHKAYRRFGVPLATALFLHTIPFLLAEVAVCAFLHIGYGIPDVNDPSGSTFGRFWYRLLKGRQPWVDVATRGTIFAGMAAAFYLASRF